MRRVKVAASKGVQGTYLEIFPVGYPELDFQSGKINQDLQGEK